MSFSPLICTLLTSNVRISSVPLVLLYCFCFLPPRSKALPVDSQGKGSNPTELYADGALRGDMVKLVTGSSSAPILGKGVLLKVVCGHTRTSEQPD